MFDKYRFKEKDFQIVIDGAGLVTFKERHCKNCLKKTYNKEKEDEYSIYYHYVLEAKLVVGDIVISIDTEFIENEEKSIKYWNDIKCEEVQFEKQANILKFYQKKKDKITEFMWITSFKVTEKNQEEMVYYGRQRWKIENEGFNMQKNGTFDIEHVYSKNYNAMKAHYFFIQFAHTIREISKKYFFEVEILCVVLMNIYYRF